MSAPGPPAPGPAAAARPARRPSAADLAAVALCAAVWVGVAGTLPQVRYEGNPDEVHYLVYAQHLAERGLPGVRELFHDFATEPARWRFPNPLRLGYLLPAALWLRAFGASFEALSHFSLFCHVLLLATCYALLRGLLRDGRALAATALLACSPLWLALARRALVDSAATLAAALAFAAFAACLGAPRSLRRAALFAAAFGFAMLVKETNALLALPFGLALLAQRLRSGALPAAAAAACLAAPLAVFSLWWLAAGELATLMRIAELILRSPASNPYALQYGGGGLERYPLDFLLLAPATALVGLAGAALLAFDGRAGRAEPGLLLLALLCASLWIAYEPFTKNVRYVALIELPLRTLAVAALWRLPRSRGGARAAALLALLLLCWGDLRSFDALFVRGGIYDPVSAELLSARGLLPAGAP